MTTKEIHVYTVDSHPDPYSVYEWVRENWGDLGANIKTDLYRALKTFHTISGIEAKLLPAQGRVILETYTIGRADVTIDAGMRASILTNEFKDMTGDIWEGILTDPWTQAYGRGIAGFAQYVEEMLASEIEHTTTDEYIHDLCMANEYYFELDGTHIPTGYPQWISRK